MEAAMPNDLPLPPELQHLVEKRERAQRRQKRRRGCEERRETDLGPLGALEWNGDAVELPVEDRRSQRERRTGRKRRKSPRRKSS
jgi:hypothetical protein